MYVKLRIGYGDILGVKCFLYTFVRIEEHVPVIFIIHPCPYGEIHTAVSHFEKPDKWRRILEYPFILGQYLQQYFLYLVFPSNSFQRIHHEHYLTNRIFFISAKFP